MQDRPLEGMQSPGAPEVNRSVLGLLEFFKVLVSCHPVLTLFNWALSLFRGSSRITASRNNVVTSDFSLRSSVGPHHSNTGLGNSVSILE